MKFIDDISMSMSIPHLFRCPISLELFTDPVTLSTGQTYDRPFIEKWLSLGNLTCPVTMQKLTDLSLVPNHTLTHLIHQWHHNHSSFPPSLPTSPSHPDDDKESDFLAQLKHTLEDISSEGKKLEAVRKVLALSLHVSIGENEGLVKLGFFPLLIHLALTDGRDMKRMEIVETALRAAVKMMPLCYDLNNLNRIITEEPKFRSLINLLKWGSCGIKISLCRVLETVVTSPQTKELSDMVSTSEEVLSCLFNIVEVDRSDYDDDDNEENVLLSEAGVRGILALALCGLQQQEEIASVHVKLVNLGVIGALIRCIWRDLARGMLSTSRVTTALEALEVLIRADGGKEALLREPNGVRVLVRSVFRVLDHHHGGSESAVKCLMEVCVESREAREEAVRAGVVTQLLLLMQSQCSERTKARGRTMLKMLRTVWGKDNGSWKGWCGAA